VLPTVLPVLSPTLFVVLRTEPEAVLPTVLPVLSPTLFVVLRTEPEAVLPTVLPVLAPVLSIASSWCFDLSSPFPLLPPATSPRESELFSPDSLCLLFAATSADAPALLLLSDLPWSFALPEASPLELAFAWSLDLTFAPPLSWAFPLS
jgi:hypothetical protein